MTTQTEIVTIDLEGRTLMREALASNTRYTNGGLQYCRTSKAENIVIGTGITIFTGEEDGLYFGSCTNIAVEPDVRVTLAEGVEAAKGTAGIHFRKSASIVIEKIKVELACSGLALLEVDGFTITRSDFTGCSEDGIRVFGSQNGVIDANLFTRFRLVNEASHRDGVQIAPFYNAKEGPKRSRNILVSNNLAFVGAGGVEFTALFNRPYLLDGSMDENPEQPNCENVDMVDNLCFTQGGHGLVNHGNGETSRNLVVGYEGNAWASGKFADKHVIGKLGLTAFTGTANDNRAEHFYYRDETGVTWRPGWVPEGSGNEWVEPWPQHAIDEKVAEWMARFRPVAPVAPALPAGVTDELLAFYDERYVRRA
ncbi:right-handed parallel beta-helix repeat-containing protein [Novosphingobium sp. YJ-S2-02]|uniref:Right-handed parallel beta-helix repeat-containing protein n=1 Tax=Novosphingobium aureum TaxID=2792964 RepID=A0A931HC13_9SPHN|nr:right-handed parallel beta-helix repeat-containing protein [Novosphingobium aureum]MBH0113262.1 right-handed parallel beta-helix repeat-containing protein [Novosphingobium aureum]